MRCSALGRKNCLFFGSDQGGINAAVLYSLTRTCNLSTCNLNDIDPVAYLTDVLGNIASGWPARFTDLLSQWWVQQHHDLQTAPAA